MSEGIVRRLLGILAAALTVLILADQLLDGRIRRSIDAALDGNTRRRSRETWTPGAELVIRRAEEIAEEAAKEEGRDRE